jgi:hypothetical protein
MASRKEIINKFYRGDTEGSASSLRIKGEKKGTSLYSYNTPIAYRDVKGNIYTTDKKFSKSTTTQQKELKRSYNVKELDNKKYKEKLDKENVFYYGSRL